MIALTEIFAIINLKRCDVVVELGAVCIGGVHAALECSGRLWGRGVVDIILKALVLVLELSILAHKTHPDLIRGTVTVLSHDDLTQTTEILARLIIIINTIVLGAVDETYHIRILLNRTRLTQVGELRFLALHVAIAGVAFLDVTVQLAQCNNRNIQFLGNPL